MAGNRLSLKAPLSDFRLAHPAVKPSSICGSNEPATNPMQDSELTKAQPGHLSSQALRWSSLRTELLWIYEGGVQSASLRVTTDHRYGYWVWLLRKGEVTVKAGTQSLTAREGQWLIPPQGILSQEFSPDARILSVHFLCQWPTGENLFIERDGLVLESAQFPQLERSAARLERLVHRHFPDVKLDFLEQATEYPVFLKFKQRFLQWLIDFFDTMTEQKRTFSHEGGGDERLARAAECLHMTPMDSPFPAARLQQETSLGRTQLDRLFWKAFHTTTREYWEYLKQESAINSLIATAMPIKEISYRLGFKQPSHFTKWFSRRVGQTPHDYRSRSPESIVFKLDKPTGSKVPTASRTTPSKKTSRRPKTV